MTLKHSVSEWLELILRCAPGLFAKRRRHNGSIIAHETWSYQPEAQEAMRRLALAHMASLQPCPSHFQGRGVVICGGGVKYFPSAWVTIKKLRYVGCDLPIQLWHMGDREMDPHLKKLLAPLGVTTVDAERVRKHVPVRILGGWELKPYAMACSGFEEVLLLDADSAPLVDPTYLFNTKGYQEHGAIFWPDLEHTDNKGRLSSDLWSLFGLPYRDEPSFESGQLVVNKRQAWKGLMMALWYCEYSDFTFDHVYGDKECFHLGWRKAGLECAMTAHKPTFEDGCAIVQRDFQGRQLFLHRTGAKWEVWGGNRYLKLPDEELHHSFIRQLRKVWPCRMWSNPTPDSAESSLIEHLTGQRFCYLLQPKEGEGVNFAITFGEGGRFSGMLPSGAVRWEVNTVKGEHVLTFCSETEPVAHLRWRDGSWNGERLAGGKITLLSLASAVSQS